MAHSVFICHATEDKVTADAVCAFLEGQGIRCWIAPRDVLPGMDWAEAVLKGINESSLMVLVLSARANASDYVKNEVERAVHAHKPLIPFRIENVDPSGCLALYLSRRHWLDAHTLPLEKHMEKLAETARLLVGSGEEYKRAERVSLAGDSCETRDEVKKVSRHHLRRRGMIVGTSAAVACMIVAVLVVLQLKETPDTPPAGPKKEDYLAAANEYWRAGNYPEATSQFRQILEIDSADFEAQLNLATVLREQGNMDKAIPEYEKAISLNSKDPRPYEHLGEIFEHKRELEKALRSYRECLRTLPEGSEFDEVSRRIKDIETRRQVPLGANPRVDSARDRLDTGVKAFNRGDFDQCIEQMEALLESNPRDSTAQYFLAEAMKRRGERAREEEIQDVLKTAEDSYRNADYEECIRQAERALALDPENTQARQYADSASTRLARGDIEGIRDRYVKALTDGDLLTFLETRCSPELYQRMGKDAETIHSQYDNLQCTTSNISIGLKGKDRAVVGFSIITTGVRRESGRKKVVSDGTLTWEMEQQDGNWRIVNWTYQPVSE
jgi:tetratricopeptide (TPR) repeat protein